MFLGELHGWLDEEARAVESPGRPECPAMSHASHEPGRIAGRRRSHVATKTRKVAPEIAIIDRHMRRESSVEEVLLEMFHASVPRARARRIAERLWGHGLGQQDLGELTELLGSRIAGWLQRPLGVAYPYVSVSRAAFGRELGGVCLGPQLVVVTGIDVVGHRSLLAIEPWPARDGWEVFWRRLLERGLRGLRLLTGPGDGSVIAPALPLWAGAVYQRCLDDFHATVVHSVLPEARPEIASRLRRIHEARSAAEARMCAGKFVTELEGLQWLAAAGEVERGIDDTLAFYGLPPDHQAAVRSRAVPERVIRQMRERHRVVGAFSSEASSRLLVAAWFRRLMGGAWGRHTLPGPAPVSGASFVGPAADCRI